MSREILQLDTTLQRQLNSGDLKLHDLEALRLILNGGSVIDWRRLNLHTPDEVDAYLRLLAIDLSTQAGHERLRFVYTEATNYLEEHLEMPLPMEAWH